MSPEIRIRIWDESFVRQVERNEEFLRHIQKLEEILERLGFNPAQFKLDRVAQRITDRSVHLCCVGHTTASKNIGLLFRMMTSSALEEVALRSRNQDGDGGVFRIKMFAIERMLYDRRIEFDTDLSFIKRITPEPPKQQVVIAAPKPVPQPEPVLDRLAHVEESEPAPAPPKKITVIPIERAKPPVPLIDLRGIKTRPDDLKQVLAAFAEASSEGVLSRGRSFEILNEFRRGADHKGLPLVLKGFASNRLIEIDRDRIILTDAARDLVG